jgi:uncharacterized membrane protein YphA (DoxX/SURF4 family)
MPLLGLSIQVAIPYPVNQVSLQRLFSTFANGWPGAGILLQRGLTGFILLHHGIVHALENPQAMSAIPDMTGAAAGIFLLLGFWTPVAGGVASVAELVVILTGVHEPLVAAMLATLSATIAMIGPGAWSIDARIFGRKHIETRLPPRKW